MFAPCPFDLHVVFHSLYDPIREIGNGTRIVVISILDFSLAFVPIHDH